MSGKKETTLEKILKPARISPLATSFAALVGIFLYLGNRDGDFDIIDFVVTSSEILPSAYFYINGKNKTSRHTESLKKYGYSESYARSNMEEYCDRQSFYVAAVENGYREEINKTIREFPSESKKYNCLPHF